MEEPHQRLQNRYFGIFLFLCFSDITDIKHIQNSGFIKRIFPDAKFVFISRNPYKTLKSQLEFERAYCKAHYIEDPQFFRKNDMNPHPPYYNNEESWYHLFHTQLPNDMYGHLLWPRVWPRCKPDHQLIQKYLKQDKCACATAVGIVQHDRIVRETFDDKKNGISIDNDNLFEIWHEDVLDDPALCLKRLHKYLELDASDKDRIEWLEREDFPEGKANVKRVKQSSQWEKGLNFGDETDEVNKILEPCFKSYQNRKGSK